MRFMPILALAIVVCPATQARTDESASQPAPALGGTPWLSVATFGAVGDGKTINTAAIQQAIDAAAGRGGGTVFIPAGKWVTGTLVLKDNVTLHLDNGATLLASTDLADYPPHRPAYHSLADQYVRQALIYAEGAHNIAIVGCGIIDGRGSRSTWPISSKDSSYLRRPYLLWFITCTHVRVEGITLRDSPMWVQHYLACEDVTIQGVSVWSNCNVNNDMIDIDGCSNVRVWGCTGDTGDDAITLKSTGVRACENVTISDCVVASHCNAIKMGTESIGGFRNITISNCAVHPSRYDNVQNGKRAGLAGIALEAVDGGTLDRVTISNITMEGTTSPIFMRLGNRGRKVNPDAPARDVGSFRNVVISNVIATGASSLGCPIAGLPDHLLEGITLRDINITFAGGGTLQDAARDIPERLTSSPECTMFGTLPAYGFFIRHVRGLTLDNVRLACAKPDDRPVIVGEDVSNLTIRDLTADTTEKTPDMIVLKGAGPAMVTGCTGPRASNVPFVHMVGEFRQVSVIGNDLRYSNTPWRIDEPPNQPGRGRDDFYQAANSLPISHTRHGDTLEEKVEELRQQLRELESRRR